MFVRPNERDDEDSLSDDLEDAREKKHHQLFQEALRNIREEMMMEVKIEFKLGWDPAIVTVEQAQELADAIQANPLLRSLGLSRCRLGPPPPPKGGGKDSPGHRPPVPVPKLAPKGQGKGFSDSDLGFLGAKGKGRLLLHFLAERESYPPLRYPPGRLVSSLEDPDRPRNAVASPSAPTGPGKGSGSSSKGKGALDSASDPAPIRLPVEVLAVGLRGSHVITLELHGTLLGDEGVKPLAAALKETLVQSLDLTLNEIGLEGARSLAQGLKSSKVTKLSLAENSLESDGVAALAAVLKECSLLSLDLSDNRIGVKGGPGGWKAQGEGRGWDSLPPRKKKTSPDPGGVMGLAALAAVLCETSIESLKLDKNGITEEGLGALAAGLKSSRVVSLSLVGNAFLRVGALADVLKETSIRSLDLSLNRILTTGPLALASGSLPPTCWTSGRQDHLAEGLKASKVTSLIQQECELGVQGAQVLGAVLKETPLESLDLRDNEIGDEGARALAEGLQSLKVTSLELSSNDIESDGAKALAEALTTSSVQTLDLRYNKIGDEGACALAGSLPSSSVTSLDLTTNGIGNEGLRALAGALKSSKVTALHLSSNPVGDEGVRALASALGESSLVRLSLGSNDLTPEGQEALAEGLRSSKVTNLAVAYFDALAAVLRESSIEKLDLRCTNWGEVEDPEGLLEGLKDSPVTWLDLAADHQARDSWFPFDLEEVDAVIKSNQARRSFVLQMEMVREEDEIQLTFRNLVGAVVAALTWSLDRPVQDLPKVVLTSMHSSGFQPPFEGLRAVNLKLVRPDGALLDVSPTAAPFAQQVGISSVSTADPHADGGAPSAAEQ